MPLRDPRLRPALERVPPADDNVPGNSRPDFTTWLFLFGDGDWHPVTVKMWRRDRFGREIVDVEWHATGSTWSETYVVSPDKMRELEA